MFMIMIMITSKHDVMQQYYFIKNFLAIFCHFALIYVQKDWLWHSLTSQLQHSFNPAIIFTNIQPAAETKLYTIYVVGQKARLFKNCNCSM